jgi:hypothetical protein
MKRIFSHPLVALVAGAALRFFFVLKYPAGSGDTVLYEQLAANWLQHHIYALTIDGVLTPVDTRMPGYPAFLAICYAVRGKTGDDAHLWVMSVQVFLDWLTCLATACIATALFVLARNFIAEKPSPEQGASRHRVFVITLWLAALCPFTANYVAVLLTETWATLFTALATLCVCLLALRLHNAAPAVSNWRIPKFSAGWFATAAGIATGLGTLFRPETPIILIAAIIVLFWHFLRQHDILRAVRLCALMTLGCVLPLLPWAARNAITLHEFQFLAPKNSNLPGELIPTGFMAWEKTWLHRIRDSYLVTWKLNDEAINLDEIPASAYDSPEEKQRVAAQLEAYNTTSSWTPEEDAAFGQIAKERTARHPLRTYLWIPAARIFAIWFTPRIELLPFTGHVFPLAEAWEFDATDQVVTATLTILNVIYLLMAVAGAYLLWRKPQARLAITLLLAFIALRTAFLTTQEAPEPRYVLECFPIVLALAAQIFVRKDLSERTKTAGE